MSVSGLCSVCEQREAEYVCNQCGSAVCEAHYESTADICTVCAAGVSGGTMDGDGTTNGDGTGDPDSEYRI